MSSELLRRLGVNLRFDPRRWSIRPHLVTPLLFLGPLYACFLGGHLPFQHSWTFRDNLLPVFCTWPGLRNHVLVRFPCHCPPFRLLSCLFSPSSLSKAPITEEVVFRACVLAVYHLSCASKARMILLSPLSFGAGMQIWLFSFVRLLYLFPFSIAHVHHAWDTYNRYGRSAAAAKRAIIMCCASLSSSF